MPVNEKEMASLLGEYEAALAGFNAVSAVLANHLKNRTLPTTDDIKARARADRRLAAARRALQTKQAASS